MVDKSRVIPDLTVAEQELGYTVPPGLLTPISIAAQPGSLCRVGSEDGDEPALAVVTDPEGVARFYVTPLLAAARIPDLVIACDVDGRHTRHRLSLRVDWTPTGALPAPPDREIERAREMRPPVVLDELLSLSDGALVELGYPPRPDRDRVPAAFSAWLRAVSIARVGVAPELVPHPDLLCGPASTSPVVWYSNWSGFEAIPGPRFAGPLPGVSAGPYRAVLAGWQQPAVRPAPRSAGPRESVSIWVGLDGETSFGLKNLWQAGTATDLTLIGNPPVLSASTYFAWTEFWPTQPSAMIVSGLQVSPHDDILCSVSVGDEAGNTVVAGAEGFATIINVTTGQTTQPAVKTRVGSSILGHTAEWVVERPSNPTTLVPYPLADYGSLDMFGATALGKFSANFTDTVNRPMGMYDAARLPVSTVEAVARDAMRFTAFPMRGPAGAFGNPPLDR